MTESEYLPVQRPRTHGKSREERELANALQRFTSKHDRSYDAEFDAEIRSLQPKWFIGGTVRENKRKLMAWARSGRNRPSVNSIDSEEKRLAGVLNDYLRKRKNHKYDAVFCNAIRLAAPQWFEDTAAANKIQLLELAATGKKRPRSKSLDSEEQRLGSALVCYTSERRQQYDASFKQQLMALRPDWIRKRSTLKKEKLFALAKSGAERPNSFSSDREIAQLGQALIRYTTIGRSTYDQLFSEQIYAIRPEWRGARMIDEMLLKLASDGGKRPNKRSKDPLEKRLGGALSNRLHTNHPLATKLRALRPEWFMKAADENRRQLLALAKGGGKRPSASAADLKERHLASALIGYTSKTARVKEPNKSFYDQLYNIRPDWFDDSAAMHKAELLELARSGADKPKGALGLLLYSYVAGFHKQYDAAFDQLIASLRPDWAYGKKGPFAVKCPS